MKSKSKPKPKKKTTPRKIRVTSGEATAAAIEVNEGADAESAPEPTPEPAAVPVESQEDEDAIPRETTGPNRGRVSYQATRQSKGDVSMYLTSIPVDELAPLVYVLRRADDSVEGFQRHLDPKRVQEIADYVDAGKIVPGTITVSAQPEAELEFDRAGRQVRFVPSDVAFMSIDGQHRLAGFLAAKTRPLRVAVTVVSGLARQDEAAIFSDVNDKHKGVPKALILEIKGLAGRETDSERVLRALYDALNVDQLSPLFGRLVSTGTGRGKINRVTFNAAMRSTLRWKGFAALPFDQQVRITSAYLGAFAKYVLDTADDLTRPAVFAAAMATMVDIAKLSFDRFGRDKAFADKSLEAVLRPIVSVHLRPDGRLKPKGEMVADIQDALRGEVPGMVAADEAEEPDDETEPRDDGGDAEDYGDGETMSAREAG